MVAGTDDALSLRISHIVAIIVLWLENGKGHYACAGPCVFDGKGFIQNESKPQGIFAYAKSFHAGFLTYHR